MSGDSGTTRLNKHISDTGMCSRREADRLIEQGRVRINGRVATITIEDLLLFVEVLENIRLQISAGADIHDFEQRRQRIVMINGVVTRNEHAKTSEQMLQTQVGAYALIKRIFVQDHANFSGGRIIARSEGVFGLPRQPAAQVTVPRYKLPNRQPLTGFHGGFGMQ